jgi:hypothetical protein
LAGRHDIGEIRSLRASAAYGVPRRDRDAFGAGVTHDRWNEINAVVANVNVELNGQDVVPRLMPITESLTHVIADEGACLFAMPITEDESHAQLRLAQPRSRDLWRYRGRHDLQIHRWPIRR